MMKIYDMIGFNTSYVKLGVEKSLSLKIMTQAVNYDYSFHPAF